MVPATPPTSVCVTPARLHSPGTCTHQVQVEKDAFSQAHKTLTAQLSAGQEHVDQVSDTAQGPLIHQGTGDGR